LKTSQIVCKVARTSTVFFNSIEITPDSGQVTEGSDAQLECRVSCRPPPTTFTWYKDGATIATEQNLTLRNLTSQDSGTYR
jgi:hypothetical protein